MNGLTTLFRRELALAWSGGGGPLLACGFFLCLTVLIPLAASPSPERSGQRWRWGRSAEVC